MKAGDLAAIPGEGDSPREGEPLALELAHFVESVAKAKQPKVGGALGKSALEVAITIDGANPGRAGMNQAMTRLPLARRRVRKAGRDRRARRRPRFPSPVPNGPSFRTPPRRG